MQAIGPEFLHQPLPGLPSLSLRRASEWFLAGLRIAIPSSVANFGWRPILALTPSDSGGRPSLIERSFLGDTRCGPADAETRDLPLAIALAAADVFEARVNLPAAARRDLEEAVSHRLDRLSPLPRELVQFAIGRSEEAGDGRIDAGIAIVRKETIDASLKSAIGKKVSLIGSSADERGRFAHVFFERQAPTEGGARLAARLAAGVGSILIFFAGADLHLRRRLVGLEAHEAALIGIAKAEKARFQFLEEPSAGSAPGASGAEALALLDAIGDKLPPKAWIEEISFEAGVATIRGFAPEGETWPADAAPALVPSDRPGVAMFSIGIDASLPDE